MQSPDEPRLTDGSVVDQPIRVRVRLFAMQRELAGTREVPIELAAGATVDDAWQRLVDQVPGLAPGRASVRFAVNGDYADASASLQDHDEVAFIPPVSGGAGPSDPGARRILEIRETPFGAEILAELTDHLATLEDGAAVGFLGRTRITPGTAAPGQEDEARRHAGRAVDSLEYEAHDTMAIRVLDQIADEIQERFDIARLAIVHRVGTVPLGEVSIAVVAVSAHRDAAFLAAKYAIDETKARVPIWKAERFRDGHVWIGRPARTTAGPSAADPASATGQPSAAAQASGSADRP